MKTANQNLVFNLDVESVRTDRIDGVEYYVAPAVMMLEGVHEGTGGKIYYPAAELNRVVKGWNNKPATVYHPPEGEDGVLKEATDPAVLEAQRIGIVLNTKYDPATTKQHTECWIEKEKTARVDNRVIEAIENKQILEVSTGLFMELDESPGVWNGQEYDAIARNLQPDHFAILPDKIGACSVKKGAGLLNNEQKQVQNELSFSDIQCEVRDLLATKFGEPGKYWDGYIVDVLPESKRVIFSVGYGYDNYRSIGYSVANDKVSLSGDAVTVERVIQYKAASETTQVANSLAKYVSNLETVAMNKKALVDGLINNGRFKEEQREWLMKQDDAIVQQIAGSTQTAVQNKLVNNNEPTPTPAPVVAPVTGATPTSLAALLAGATPAQKFAFNQMETAFKGEKERCIAIIVANANNKMPKEWLEKVDDLSVLQGMAALASPPVAPFGQVQNELGLPPGLVLNTSYVGAAGGFAPQTGIANEAPLEAPTIEYPSPFAK